MSIPEHPNPDVPTSSTIEGTPGTALSRCPPEIFSCIFCHLPPLAEPNERDLHAPAFPWRHLLHVCRRWREIAFDTKELWQVIPLGHIEWTKMALRFSSPRTISVVLENHWSFPVDSNTPSKLYEAVELALLESHRVEKIALSLYSPDESYSPDEEDQSPIVLKALERAVPDELVDFSLRGHDTTLDLWRVIFKSEPTKLRRLVLEKCFLSPNPRRLFPASLTTLELSEYDLEWGYTLTMHLSEIQSLLLLEVLSIYLRRPIAQEGLVSLMQHLDRPPFLLPRLKRFFFAGDYDHLCAYLYYIDAPLPCTFNFTISTFLGFDRMGAAPGWQETISIIASFLRPRISSLMRTFDAQLTVDIFNHCAGLSRGTVIFEVATRDHTYTNLAFDWGVYPESSIDFPPLSALMNIVPNVVVVSLLSIKMTLGGSDWGALRPILSRAQEIRFPSPIYVSDFPLVHHEPSIDSMLNLGTIRISFEREQSNTQYYKDSFTLVHSLLQNAMQKGGLVVIMRLGRSCPTAEELTTLKPYGDTVRLENLSRSPPYYANPVVH